MTSLSKVKKVIAQNLQQFERPGVLSVRPGYRMKGGWITDEPAIVVTVDDGNTFEQQGRPPESLGGIPVDVRQATPLERMRASQPETYARVAALLPEARLPSFGGERSPAAGVEGAPPAAAADIEAQALRAPSKEQIDYVAPDGVALDAITDDVTITCHASPDAGWMVLKDFLGGVQERLTVGLYDFTSKHVLDWAKTALAGKSLSLVLDHPTRNPTADQTDEDTHKALDAALGKGLEFAWALVRSDPFAPKWIYPTAYHIKVAVRDGTSFWLSSGNWNNSNQPDIAAPWDNPAAAQPLARKSDRDWHVVVQNNTLADVFERFLRNDLKVAAAIEDAPEGTAVEATAEAADARELGPILAGSDLSDLEITAEAVGRSFQTFFKPQQITGRMTIQPVLTPDNYWDTVLPFIRSAETSFCMQTQYIHPSNDAHDDARFMDLIDAVGTLITQGKAVRLILSQWQTAPWLERLQGVGIDLSCVRIQTGVHNKGMIVDGKAVALGSHNWSAEGTLRNRDATLIIHNEDVARYFGQIFDHDWENLAAQQVVS